MNKHAKRIISSKYFFFVIGFFSLCLLVLWIFSKPDELKGKLEAKTIPVFSLPKEQIQKWYVSKGDQVKKGDILFQLNDLPYKHEKIKEEKKLQLAEKTLRFQKLDVEEKTMEYIKTKKAWSLGEKKEDEVDFAIKSLEKSQARYDITKAEIDALQSSLEIVEEKLQNCYVTAPCSGIVKEMTPFPSYNEPACLLYDLATLGLSVESSLPEKEFQEKFIATVPSYPDTNFDIQLVTKEKLSQKKFRYSLTLSSKDQVSLFPDMEVRFKNK